MLARLRVERKLSVADVAQRLKYGVRQIEALEAEEFDRLPGATFVRGMVRGYAKLLETDPEPIIVSLDQRYVPAEISLDLRAKRVPFAPGGKRSGTRTYLLLSLVVLAVAGVVYEWRAGAFPWARLALSTTPQQKQALFARTGAVAVDMESAAIAEVAASRGLPFVAVRAVLDPAARSLPQSAVGAVDSSGRLLVKDLVRALLRHPADLPGVLWLWSDLRLARGTLAMVARRAGLQRGLRDIGTAPQ